MSLAHHHRSNLPKNQDDDERSEGELDSSLTDTDDETPASNPQSIPKQTSQSWTNILTEQTLSSIMSNALADNSEIIHIDDPIAQQGANPLTYVFPPGTDVEEYFQRKEKQAQDKKPTRQQLKNLSRALNREKNHELLRAILTTIGCQRAFQYAQEAIRAYENNHEQNHTLGGFFFKMLINDLDNQYLNENEREQIKKRNQAIQKAKKKTKKKKKKKTTC